MTEDRTEDALVTVRAQVMARDESTEGWLPLQGGGLANVSIRKRNRLPAANKPGHEYIIYGQRISDQTCILSCTINRDLQYFKVMPTFHHWKAGLQRNGLTFQTAADARAFNKGILRAYDDLTDAPNETSPLYKYVNNHIGEDDVFMTLDLPLDTSESKSSSEGSGGSHQSIDSKSASNGGNGDARKQQYTKKRLPAEQKSSDTDSEKAPAVGGGNGGSVHSGSQKSDGSGTGIGGPTNGGGAPLEPVTTTTTLASENFTYVQLTTTTVAPPGGAGPGGFDYPSLDRRERRDSLASLKKRAFEMPGGVGGKDPALLKATLRCRYCHEIYSAEWNRRGACEEAPDCFRAGIETVSCMRCASGMLYHCMADSEGDTVRHPCICADESWLHCTKRWLSLALLSLLVPCLCCYPPLKTCHWIGVSCGFCGGRHKPQI